MRQVDSGAENRDLGIWAFSGRPLSWSTLVETPCPRSIPLAFFQRNRREPSKWLKRCLCHSSADKNGGESSGCLTAPCTAELLLHPTCYAASRVQRVSVAMRPGESRSIRYLKERTVKIFNMDRRGQAQDCEPEPPYDHEPIFFYPVTCCFCNGEGCIMCEDQTPIRAAGLPDMTIRRQP
jgi:hypothetical protein